MLYAVIYELKNRKKDYSKLYKKLTEYEAWMHYIETFWMIKSKKNAKEISKDLLPLIDKRTDFIVITQIDSDREGWFPRDAWNWISKYEEKEEV